MKKKVLIISIITILCLILIEIISSLILRYNKDLQIQTPVFNRQISGFYIYKNSDGFKHSTIKQNPKESDVVINEFGFIYNKEISKEKPDNTVRIFITGGSAAFGSGQSKPYNSIKEYPSGIFSYESSIEGNLERKLTEKYPNKDFEVINACSSGRKLNQSVAQYLALIKDFSPDIIISIDGMNDLSTINGLSPYEIDEKYLLNKYIELENISKEFKDESYLATINLISRIKFHQLKSSSNERVAKESNKLLEYDKTKINKSTYLKYKSDFINGSTEFTSLISYYNAICKVDSVDFIFCIQPLLYREQNKELSDIENKMQNSVNPINISLSNTEIPESEIKELEFLGDLTLRYFFDDYLSKKIDTLAHRNGFAFVDLNKEISNIDESVEFYVDYCHLTFEANEIIADILTSEVENIIFETNDNLE